MAKKINDEELKNVSGGAPCGAFRSKCYVCNGYDAYEFWTAVHTDPQTKKQRTVRMCKSCANKLINNPEWSNFKWIGYCHIDWE